MVQTSNRRFWKKAAGAVSTYSPAVRAVAGGLLLCLTLSLCGFFGQYDDLRSRVLRLHILANSNESADQALKLQVRDAVTAACADWFDETDDAAEAAALVQERFPALQAIAEEVVHAQGYTYPVRVELCETYFPTRRYGTVTLPAGNYTAVRILLGEGAGNNWWCVLFPPMCVAASVEAKTPDDVLTDGEHDLVTAPQKYAVRLKVVEWLTAIGRWFEGE